MLFDYLKLTREQRTAHLDLTTPCELGGPNPKHAARRALASYLDIDIPLRDAGVICHRCKCNSMNGYCTNPQHLYLGTHSENQWDGYEDGTRCRDIDIKRWRDASHTPTANAKRKQTAQENRHKYQRFGSSNANSRLTDQQREEIRNSSDNGPTLAKKYGVTTTTIYNVKKANV